MPTPVGHMLSGTLVVAARRRKGSFLNKETMLIMLCVLLPDIDFVFGFMSGNPNQYHHQFTHSFSFALMAGAVIAFLSTLSFRKFARLTALYGFAVSLHILLDLLAVDKCAPYGAQIFWPFSDAYVIAPVQIFSDVTRSSQSGTFIKSLSSLHNARTVLIELLVLVPVLVLIKWKRRT